MATMSLAAPPQVVTEPGRFARLGGALRSILREPLAHFVVLGGLAFAFWPMVANHVGGAPDRIMIDASQVQRTAEIFMSTHSRPPTSVEMADMVEQQVRDEVFYREGIALGLDRGDEIIRRRIMQKMRFMVQDVVLAEQPGDAELQRFLDRNHTRYAAEPLLAFAQVYLDPSRHHASLGADAAKLLARLQQSDGRLDYGRDSDPLPLGNDFEATPLHVISAEFGEDFAAALQKATPGTWSGPIQSGFGEHLVLLRERREGEAPVLSRIRDTVLRDWQAERRQALNEQAYAAMRAKYRVDVEAQ